MDDLNLDCYTVQELLQLHSSCIRKLQTPWPKNQPDGDRILRTKNNPVGDYAEWLVAKALGLTLEKNSTKGIDARDQENSYQIKARRKTAENDSVRLGVMRDFGKHKFNFLVAVIFNEQWEVEYAAKLPYESIQKLAKFNEHQNGHIVYFREDLLKNPEVMDITQQLREVPQLKKTFGELMSWGKT